MRQHLQAMLRLLRPHDTLRMAVRLQTLLVAHTRYMAIVRAPPVGTRAHVCVMWTQDVGEVCVLGIDYADSGTTIGLCVPLTASTRVQLDSDGSIVVDNAASAHHVFRPVSVQAMWCVSVSACACTTHTGPSCKRCITNCVTRSPCPRNGVNITKKR
jgi:hypothetical protein